MSESSVVIDGLATCAASELAMLRTRLNFAIGQFAEMTRESDLVVHVSKRTTPATPSPVESGSRTARSDVSEVSAEMQFRAVPSRCSMDRVCLPPKVRELMISTVAALEYEQLIFEEWGLKEIQAAPRSALLLHGPPGTGKTAAAHAIADWLKRPILIATTGELESKYLGDGPKRVAAFFEAARQQNAVAFIDEADTLLGRRMSVSQGSERAANSMTSQLLIEIEQFRGVIVFATNMMRNIDEAFLTRVLSLEIPLPDAHQRRLIWQRHLPARLPTRDVCLDRLSSIEGICGRDIRNAVLLAATRAAADKSRQPVTGDDLMQAMMSVRLGQEAVSPRSSEAAIPESVRRQIRESVSEQSRVDGQVA